MSGEPVGSRALDHQGGTRRVFLVHLRLDADPARGYFAGRIEHVQSSDAAHFESMDELVTFITARVRAIST